MQKDAADMMRSDSQRLFSINSDEWLVGTGLFQGLHGHKVNFRADVGAQVLLRLAHLEHAANLAPVQSMRIPTSLCSLATLWT